MGEPQNQGKSSTGMEANLAATLSYALGVVSGLIFFLIEKDNKFVRFHALQSLITFLALSVLSIVISFLPFTMGVLPLLSLVELGLWIVLMIKAYQGEKFKLPVAGDLAEKYA